MSYSGVPNDIYHHFEGLPTEIQGLDSGFRRRDEFETSFLLVIPAEAGIQGF
jgi:hypothetical protein